MKRPIPSHDWPESWKTSHHYDRMEVYGESPRSGYAYAYRERLAMTLGLIQKYTPPPARVIDVAAAQGNFSLRLAEMGYEVTWNDLRAELADYVRLKHERGAVQFVPGSAFDLAGSFDVVLIGEVIEHVAHPDQFLAHAAKLARPGGYVVMTTPNGGYIRNRLPRFSDSDPSAFESEQFKPDADGHIFLLHWDEVQRLAPQAGLAIVESAFYCNPLTHGHIKLGRVLPYLPPSFVRGVESITRRLPLSRLHSCMAVVFRTRE